MINLTSIQVEVDASFLYGILAEHEADPDMAAIFRQMSDIEMGHALAFLEKNGLGKDQLPPPSGRARVLRFIGKVLGYDYILGVLLDTEKRLSSGVLKARREAGLPVSVSDTAHVTIVRNILNSDRKISGTNLARFEKRHRSVGGNALRAAVLGGNDGLVSNFSLVMGIAGAVSGEQEILVAGLVGLLAGALSMAMGEWISVKALRSCTRIRWPLKWRSWKPIRKAKSVSWH